MATSLPDELAKLTAASLALRDKAQLLIDDSAVALLALKNAVPQTPIDTSSFLTANSTLLMSILARLGAAETKLSSLTTSTPLAALEHVVILGASLETGAFGGGIDAQSTEVQAAQSRILAATGKSVTIHQYAVAGQDVQGMMNSSLPSMLSAQAALPGGGKTLVLIGIGGNTVSSSARPLSQAMMDSNKIQLNSAITQIEAKGWDWCLFDLSWRNYSTPTCLVDRNQGSWPWVTGVSRVINAARKKLWGRNWTYSDGASWCDMYTLYRNNVQILADEVHPQEYIFTRNYVIDAAIIPAITGVPAAQKFPRDEAYTLAFAISQNTPAGNSVVVQTVSTHQGTAHIGVYASGSTPTAAQVIAGNGTGFVSKTSAVRNGTTIDTAVSQTVNGLQMNTAYKICAVFVSDAQQTSSVVSANITTTSTAAAVGTEPSVILFRKAAISGARANITQLTQTEGPTTTGVKATNIPNTAGVATGISLNVTGAFNEQGDTGNGALSVPSIFETGELSQFWYVDAATAAFNLTGLNPAKTYQVTFSGSRNVASNDATPRTGDFELVTGTVTSGSAIKTLNSANPASGTTANSVAYTLTPNSSGTIAFTYKRATGNTSGFAYLGGMHILPLS